MDLPKDPIMLLSVINTRLRDAYPSFSALCEALEVDPEEITDKLSEAGYHYDKEINQFK